MKIHNATHLIAGSIAFALWLAAMVVGVLIFAYGHALLHRWEWFL